MQWPTSIKTITVDGASGELGKLHHDSIHTFQHTQLARQVSLTMTGAGLNPIKSGALHPIFMQNLPEGSNRRYIAERLSRHANVNDMYLLALQADTGIGQLRYNSELSEYLSPLEPISIKEILTYSGSAPLFQQLLERYYLRNAISGMQPKVTVSTDRTTMQQDTIVKTFDEEYPLLTVNEFVCMEAARACGLNPPKVYLSDNFQHFVVERFDIEECKAFGFEDFTVLMKKPADPNARYQSSYEQLLKATELYTGSSIEVEKMYKYIVFNCLIGNGDAHLKNFALQYTPDMQSIWVSPPYDITHTLIYATLDDQMALKLSKDKSFPDTHRLLALASATKHPVKHPDKIIEQIGDGISDYLKTSQEVSIIPELKGSIETNLSKCLTRTSMRKTYTHTKKRKYP